MEIKKTSDGFVEFKDGDKQVLIVSKGEPIITALEKKLGKDYVKSKKQELINVLNKLVTDDQ